MITIKNGGDEMAEIKIPNDALGFLEHRTVGCSVSKNFKKSCASI